MRQPNQESFKNLRAECLVSSFNLNDIFPIQTNRPLRNGFRVSMCKPLKFSFASRKSVYIFVVYVPLKQPSGTVLRYLCCCCCFCCHFTTHLPCHRFLCSQKHKLVAVPAKSGHLCLDSPHFFERKGST